MAVEAKSSHQYSITFCCHMAGGSRGTVWQNVTGVEVHVKEMCVIELFHVEKWTPTDIHHCLRNISGNQKVHVCTVKQWAVHFSRRDSRSPPLVQMFMRKTCRLLFTSGENAQLMVVTDEKMCFAAEN